MTEHLTDQQRRALAARLALAAESDDDAPLPSLPDHVASCPRCTTDLLQAVATIADARASIAQLRVAPRRRRGVGPKAKQAGAALAGAAMAFALAALMDEPRADALPVIDTARIAAVHADIHAPAEADADEPPASELALSPRAKTAPLSAPAQREPLFSEPVFALTIAELPALEEAPAAAPSFLPAGAVPEAGRYAVVTGRSRANADMTEVSEMETSAATARSARTGPDAAETRSR